jgi:hypothetical protein
VQNLRQGSQPVLRVLESVRLAQASAPSIR